MSLSIPQASQSGLFKPGYSSYDAEDGAVIRNVSLQMTIEPVVAD
jgi:T-complex protein 1 subunit theta